MALGVRVEERPLGDDLCGFYYDAARIVIVDENMLDFQKRCTLCHELAHARFHDVGCGGVAGSKAERRARRQAALRLIDQTEYASAENLYDGDSYLMACELDVTVQVIEDYRGWLRDRPQPTGPMPCVS
ncbi:ImmA/IrrE family metallo-endopeptidase [Bifidobacterium tibiigranuli]|uniref:ImmA/IrrE family metallo-endopeptidase n=2 Tax=Bifidobacterium tibiigranuli TaxID=2172043 RepID=A0A5N6S2P6_9BIFI|nr:ImmA/IrrE family metallo-endopeptidase [Bifidobacterium tibiigranuli]KAE8129800.1 ImmA/IrrE family metallo-endopeptidase [Bifidobacterium tibiigranuli]